jgi:uncharacterized membrane protein
MVAYRSHFKLTRMHLSAIVKMHFADGGQLSHRVVTVGLGFAR